MPSSGQGCCGAAISGTPQLVVGCGGGDLPFELGHGVNQSQFPLVLPAVKAGAVSFPLV